MPPDGLQPTDDWSAALMRSGAAGGDSALADEWAAALAEQGTGRTTGDVAAEWATMIEDGESDDLPGFAGNERILSQDEIDGVVGFSPREVQASGAGGVRAIVDSDVVQHERLPMLEVVLDRAIRLLSISLRNLFQDNVEASLDTVTSVRFGDYLDAIPLPTLLGVFRAETWGNSGLVTVDANLAYATFDLLLGGKRGGASSRLDGRPFTGIEMTLVRRLVEIVLGDLERSFEPLSPVAFGVDRIETNPRLATIARPGDAAILIGLRLDIDGRGGILHVVFPYATIEPIRGLLTQNVTGETLGRDPAWEGHLATEVWQADMTVEAVLHEVMLPLRQVMRLKVGDTLMFDAKPTDLITVRCGDWALTQGRIGRVDGSIAVQVTRPLRRSRTTIQAYEASMNGRSDR